MNHSAPASVKFNVQDLVRAVGMDNAYDTLNLTLTTAQWEIFGGYLQPFAQPTHAARTGLATAP